ncbi:MAG: nucleotidyltransferase domain-containing protein [Candidatus Heimdallarchaeota archaeon]|nr:MAG: nucleotidyltransferase domain-containing protein [Candidatus Heimdallarchaeota archaeon]
MTKQDNANLSELMDKLKECLNPILINFGIKFAYLSGSWVKGHQHSESDIDIFISYPLFEKDRGEFLEKFLDLSTKVELSCKIRGIEFIVLEKVPLHVQFRAVKDGILIYESSEDVHVNYLENLMKYYYDHKIWFEKYLNQAV